MKLLRRRDGNSQKLGRLRCGEGGGSDAVALNSRTAAKKWNNKFRFSVATRWLEVVSAYSIKLIRSWRLHKFYATCKKTTCEKKTKRFDAPARQWKSYLSNKSSKILTFIVILYSAVLLALLMLMMTIKGEFENPQKRIYHSWESGKINFLGGKVPVAGFLHKFQLPSASPTTSLYLPLPRDSLQPNKLLEDTLELGGRNSILSQAFVVVEWLRLVLETPILPEAWASDVT